MKRKTQEIYARLQNFFTKQSKVNELTIKREEFNLLLAEISPQIRHKYAKIIPFGNDKFIKLSEAFDAKR
jgi:hypothetical protein